MPTSGLGRSRGLGRQGDRVIPAPKEQGGGAAGVAAGREAGRNSLYRTWSCEDQQQGADDKLVWKVMRTTLPMALKVGQSKEFGTLLIGEPLVEGSRAWEGRAEVWRTKTAGLEGSLHGGVEVGEYAEKPVPCDHRELEGWEGVDFSSSLGSEGPQRGVGRGCGSS